MPEGKEIADCGLGIGEGIEQKVDFRSKSVDCRLATGQTD